jgi:hypothetical protein
MWMFVSRRLRTWVLLAVALPLVRTIVHKAAIREQSRSPDATPARLLARTDSALTTVSGRAKRGRTK